MKISLRILLVNVFLTMAVMSLISSAQDSKTYKLCGDKFENMLHKVCTYGAENRPCFPNNDEDKRNQLRTKCCSSGCSFDDLKEHCCFNESCLAACYPGGEYKKNMGSVY